MKADARKFIMYLPQRQQVRALAASELHHPENCGPVLGARGGGLYGMHGVHGVVAVHQGQ